LKHYNAQGDTDDKSRHDYHDDEQPHSPRSTGRLMQAAVTISIALTAVSVVVGLGHCLGLPRGGRSTVIHRGVGYALAKRLESSGSVRVSGRLCRRVSICSAPQPSMSAMRRDSDTGGPTNHESS
jgi:hypothetical protein